MDNIDLVEMLSMHLNGDIPRDVIEGRLRLNIENVILSYEESQRVISTLTSKGISNIFRLKERSKLSNSLIKAYLSFHNDKLSEEAFEPPPSFEYEVISGFWSRNLISLSTEELVELKYINALMFTGLPEEISSRLNNEDKALFQEQVLNFRLFVANLSEKAEFVKAYVGDLSANIDDNILNKDEHLNALHLKSETILLKPLFEITQKIYVDPEQSLSFKSNEEFHSFFSGLLELLFKLNNGDIELKSYINEMDCHLIKRFNDGELSEPSDFKDFLNIIVNDEELDGVISKPSISNRAIEKFNGCSKRLRKRQDDKLTFDDLIIESGKNAKGGKLKNYLTEMLIIILTFFSALGYFFKISTIASSNETIESEYVYETTSGSEKTSITIERRNE